MIQETFDIKVSKFENKFSDLEKRIAQFILKNKLMLLDSNVAQIARLCNVSDASIIRFAKKLGYSGFAQMKISLASSMTLNDTITEHTTNDLYSDLCQTTHENFLRTIKGIDKKKIDLIIDKVIQAKTIFVLAVGKTYPVALDVVYKLSKLGLKIFTSELPEILITTCKNLNEDDLVLVISHSGESETLLQAVSQANENNCDVVLISNFDNSPLSKMSDDLILTNVYNIDSGLMANSFSRMTEFFLIDLLYLAIEDKLRKLILPKGESKK